MGVARAQTKTGGFFTEPQAAAILKHGILRRYLPVFAAKTGSWRGEVLYLDCYAGPGTYDDGSEGSPALALATADALDGYRGNASLHGHLIEKDPQSLDSLRGLLASRRSTWTLHAGDARDLIPGILATLPPVSPTFAFIDPFGLPVPFDHVVAIMKRGRVGASAGAATEVLINFSIPGINRVGGQLTGKGTNPGWLKSRDTHVENMNRALGGDWWHEIWQSDASDRVALIRNGYAERLRLASGGTWHGFDVVVADRWMGPPSYHLLQFTQHPHGLWAFHECLSNAEEEYREFCHRGRFDFEPLDHREPLWITEIEASVERLVQSTPQFRPVEQLAAVYGRTIGFAREKHLRAALRTLYKRGVISTEPKGPLAELLIKRAS